MFQFSLHIGLTSLVCVIVSCHKVITYNIVYANCIIHLQLCAIMYSLYFHTRSLAIQELNIFPLFFNRLWAQYLQPLKDKMTTMRDVNNIAKFNGQNLPTWKLGCWILFQQHDLVKLVIGEETLPVEVLHTAYSTHSNRC